MIAWIIRTLQQLLLHFRLSVWRLLVTAAQRRRLGSTAWWCVVLPELKPLSKVPRHVGVAALPRSPNPGLLARLVLFAADAGVDVLSMHAACSPNELAELRDALAMSLRRIQIRPYALLFGKLSRVHHFAVVVPGLAPVLVRRADVEEATEEVAIRLFSDADAGQNFASVAQRLASDSKINESAIDVDLLDRELTTGTQKLGGQEVELVMVFSRSPRLEGFPPWLLRSAEICFMHETLNELSYASFVRALHIFAKSEQRWGR